jgi:hypothetical protein
MDTVLIVTGYFFILALLITMGYLIWRMTKIFKRVEEGVDDLSIGVKQLTTAAYLMLCEQYHLPPRERINLGRELDIGEEVIGLALKNQELLQLPNPEESTENLPA